MCGIVGVSGGNLDWLANDLLTHRGPDDSGIFIDAVASVAARIDAARMAEDLPVMVVQLDEPLADPASLNVLYISRLAREHGIKVLLSGAEGDDLFTGYRRHRALVSGNLPHDDLPALCQHARINLFASCTENCPNILLEMMASDRPALVSDRVPMPEFSGQPVTYFDQENVEQLNERWLSLLSGPEQGSCHTSAAINRVSTMQWERTASTTWGMMAEVVRAKQ